MNLSNLRVRQNDGLNLSRLGEGCVGNKKSKDEISQIKIHGLVGSRFGLDDPCWCNVRLGT